VTPASAGAGKHRDDKERAIGAEGGWFAEIRDVSGRSMVSARYRPE